MPRPSLLSPHTLKPRPEDRSKRLCKSEEILAEEESKRKESRNKKTIEATREKVRWCVRSRISSFSGEAAAPLYECTIYDIYLIFMIFVIWNNKRRNKKSWDERRLESSQNHKKAGECEKCFAGQPNRSMIILKPTGGLFDGHKRGTERNCVWKGKQSEWMLAGNHKHVVCARLTINSTSKRGTRDKTRESDWEGISNRFQHKSKRISIFSPTTQRKAATLQDKNP